MSSYLLTTHFLSRALLLLITILSPKNTVASYNGIQRLLTTQHLLKCLSQHPAKEDLAFEINLLRGYDVKNK